MEDPPSPTAMPVGIRRLDIAISAGRSSYTHLSREGVVAR
jgi:hypothetical protein